MERLRALLKGSQAGASMGLSDELAGAIPAVMDKLGIAGGVTEQNKKLADEGFTGDVGPTNTEELYNKERDIERADLAKAQEEHPGTFGVGNAVGTGLASVIPANMLASAAGNANSMSDIPEALAKSAAFSKLAGAISPAMANMAGKKAPNFGKVLNQEGDKVVNASHNEIMDVMGKSNLTERLKELKGQMDPSSFDKLKQMMINATRNKIIKDKS